VSTGVLAAAHKLHALGFAVVPVPRGLKKPVVPGWQDLRLTEEQLPRHFGDGGNIGILTGSPSNGLIDVDLDCDETVALADAFLPPTAMRSGRRLRPRSHCWYRATDTLPPNITLKDGDGAVLVELRGNGRQTIVAPSLHPDDDAYVWDGDFNPAGVSGKVLSQSVLRLAAAALLVRHWPREQGSRHDIANALAGMLLLGGWSPEGAADFIRVAASTAGDEEAEQRAQDAVATARTLERGGKITGAPTLASLLGAAVVDRIRSWLGFSRTAEVAPWPSFAPLHALPVPEFPVHVLPEWLRRFVAALAEATQTPLALVGSLVLAVCAVAVGGRIRVRIREGWSEPTNAFFVVVLDPGNRKSAVFAEATEPVLAFEKEEARRMAPRIREALARRRILEARAKALERKAARAEPDERSELEQEAIAAAKELSEFQVPIAPTLFTDDVTVERLAGLLCEQGGRFAVLSAEGGIFELLAGRYTRDGAPNFDVFLKGHAGDTLRVDRMGRAEHIERPALTVGLAVQSDVLRGLAEKPGFRGRGLLARFNYAVPISLVGRRNTNSVPVPYDVAREYHDNMSFVLRQGRDSVGHELMFSPAANECLRRFEQWLEPKLGKEGEFAGLADWASKLAGGIARIAAILHVAGDMRADGLAVEERTVEAAIELGHFYLAHARAAFAEMSADAEVENARHLLSWICRRAGSEFSERDAYQGTKNRFKKVADLRPALTILVEHGYIRERKRPSGGGPGRPAGPVFEVHPDAGREGFGNSGDIGDRSEDSASNSPTSSDDTLDQNPGLEHGPQNPQYPQKDPDTDNSDEVVL
jgi:hypothetical protein